MQSWNQRARPFVFSRPMLNLAKVVIFVQITYCTLWRCSLCFLGRTWSEAELPLTKSLWEMKVLCIISLCSWAHSFWKVLTSADWGTAKCLCIFVSWTSVPDTAWHLLFSAFGSLGNTSASGNTECSVNKQWPKEGLRKQGLPIVSSS